MQNQSLGTVGIKRWIREGAFLKELYCSRGDETYTQTQYIVGSSKCIRRAQNKCCTNAGKDRIMTTVLSHFLFTFYAGRLALDQWITKLNP